MTLNYQFKITYKQNLYLFFAIIIITWISIFLKLPCYQQFFSFIFFLILPGYLFLINFINIKVRTEILILLSIGLSISFLLICGLVLNLLFQIFNLKSPLSAINLFCIVLLFNLINAGRYFYLRYCDDIKRPVVYLVSISKNLIFQIIYPIFLLIIASLGIITNLDNNGAILYSFYFLTVFYVVFVFIIDSHLKPDLNPLLIYIIAFSILLINNLSSNYLIGRDIFNEFQAFAITLNNMMWDINILSDIQELPLGLGASLSVTLLPTQMSEIFNLSSMVIVKIIFPLLFSLVPVIIYFITSSFVNKKYALLASFLYISQTDFIFFSQSMIRMQIGLIFFTLIILMCIIYKQNIFSKIVLFLLGVGLILSYYSLSYILIIILIGYLLISHLWINRKIGITNSIFMSIYAISILMSVYLWYYLITRSHFKNFILFSKHAIESMSNMFDLNTMDASHQKVLLTQKILIADKIFIYLHYIIFSLIIIGILYYLYMKYNNNGQKEIKKLFYENSNSSLIYVQISLIFILLGISSFLIPQISKGFGFGRTFLILLILLTPFLFIGCYYIANIINYFKTIDVVKLSSIIILALISVQFFSANYLIYQGTNIPRSIIFNRYGDWYGEYYIYESEISGGEWLLINQESFANNHPFSSIYTDSVGARIFRLINIKTKNSIKTVDIFSEDFSNGYICLRGVNIDEDIGYASTISILPILKYKYLLENNSLIYSNNHFRIYTGGF